jgi:HTH-type transcriptional regulator, quorum sensing regulator NprR
VGLNGIGHIILLERQKQKIKQIFLAKGICSVSYLSKIENNIVEPSDEIKELLFEKLDIDESTLDFGREQVESLYTLYKEGLKRKNRQELKEKVIDFRNDIYFNNQDLFFRYYLYLFRIYFIAYDGSIARLTPIKDILDKWSHLFGPKELFIYNVNMGLYYHVNGHYQQSYGYLKQSTKIVNQITIEDWEMADYYYVLSMSSLVNNRTESAARYSKLALDIYKDQFLLDRIIESYLILSTTYKRKLDYNEAEKILNTALELIDLHDLSEYKGIVIHNFGELSSKQGDPKLAISYFLESLKCDKSIRGYIITQFSIIEEYSKLKDSENVIKWCQKGIETLKTHHYKSDFTYHFSIYHTLHSHNKDTPKIISDAIQYFEDKKDYRFIHKYSILLADYYTRQKKYKNASLYYQKANHGLYKIKNITNWEDL